MKKLFSILLVLALTLQTAACAAEPEDQTRPESIAAQTGVSDVSADAWYAEAVGYCTAQGLIDNISPNEFSPDTSASRAVVVTALYRRAGSPSVPEESGFTDLSADERDAAAWAAREGIAFGYGDGRFGGDDPVTREQFAVMLWRAEGKPAPGQAAAFADQAEIAAYAVDAAAWARAAGIVGGRANHQFDPKAHITRKEVAVMLYRWLNGQEAEALSIELAAGGKTFSAKLEDTPAACAFLELLPMNVAMEELNGNEKYYDLSESLPTDAVKPGAIAAGDLMLYGSSCIVLFYESFSSSYSYTRLGRLDDPSGLAQAVGSGGVEVTFRRQ